MIEVKADKDEINAQVKEKLGYTLTEAMEMQAKALIVATEIVSHQLPAEKRKQAFEKDGRLTLQGLASVYKTGIIYSEIILNDLNKSDWDLEKFTALVIDKKTFLGKLLSKWI